MKIALLGDVHANLPALEAVLAHAHQQKIDAIWNIGDWVGYNAFPNEVIERLQREGAVSIVGNYDLKVLRFKKKREKWRQSKHPQKFLAFQWAYKTLTKKNRRYLRALPQEIVLRFAGASALLTHGSPASNQEALTPFTPEERLRELAAIAEVEIVVCGHSHQPFAREVDGVWFINTGSVGRPDDGDPRPSYAALTLAKRDFHVEHHRLDYDVEWAAAAIRKNNLPEAFAQMLLQGCNLDDLMMASPEYAHSSGSKYQPPHFRPLQG